MPKTDWSDGFEIKTLVIHTPSIEPAIIDIPRDDEITVTSSDYVTEDPLETHQSSSWKVTQDEEGTVVLDSVDYSTTDLTSWTADLSGASGGDTVYFWVMYHSQNFDSRASAPEDAFLTPSITKPSITDVSPGEPGMLLTDTVVTFTFSTFESTIPTETHTGIDLQVTLATDTTFSNPILNVVNDTVNLTSYDWDTTGLLTVGENYIIRLRFRGNDTSEWSDNLTLTGTGAYINQPTNVSPTNGLENQSVTLTLQTSNFDGVGTSHISTSWEVYGDAGMTELIHSNPEDGSNLTTYEIPPSILDYQRTYYWRAKQHGD